MFERFSKRNPCPLCGSRVTGEDCSRSGNLYFCHVTQEFQAPVGWTFRKRAVTGHRVFTRDDATDRGIESLASSTTSTATTTVRKRQPAALNSATDSTWLNLVKRNGRPLNERTLEIFRSRWNLPAFVASDGDVIWLRDLEGKLGTGQDLQSAFAWPEYDPTDERPELTVSAVGLRFLRDKDNKRSPSTRVSKNGRGITLPKWGNRTGPVFIVEGKSDELALLSIGLRAIGRPSNIGGADMIVAFIRQQIDAGTLNPFNPIDMTFVVVGENDGRFQKDGSWFHPGKDGAAAVSRRVADGLHQKEIDCEVYTSFPPIAFKDVKDWLNETIPDFTTRSEIELRNIGSKHLLDLMSSAELVTPATLADELIDLIDDAKQTSVADDCNHIHKPAVNRMDDPEHRIATKRDLEESLSKNPEATLGAIGATRRCRCPHTRKVVQKHTETGRYRISYFPCQRLDCLACRPWKLEKYKFWVSDVINKLPSNDAEPVYIFNVPEEQWKATYTSIYEAGGSYFRFDENGTRYFTVIATTRPSARIINHEFVYAVTPQFALDRAKQIIECLPVVKNDSLINSSHDWKIREENKPEAGWEVVGEAPAARPQAVIDILQARGIRYKQIERPERFFGWGAIEFQSLPAWKMCRLLDEIYEGGRIYSDEEFHAAPQDDGETNESNTDFKVNLDDVPGGQPHSLEPAISDF